MHTIAGLIASAIVITSVGCAVAAPYDVMGAKICELIPTQAAQEALGVEIDHAKDNDVGTPYCRYGIKLGGGKIGYVVVAYERPIQDYKGTDGQAGWDYLEKLSAEMYPDATRTELAIGDRAERVSQGSMVYSYVQVGERVFLAFSYDGAATEQGMDALMQVTADVFSQ